MDAKPSIIREMSPLVRSDYQSVQVLETTSNGVALHNLGTWDVCALREKFEEFEEASCSGKQECPVEWTIIADAMSPALFDWLCNLFHFSPAFKERVYVANTLVDRSEVLSRTCDRDQTDRLEILYGFTARNKDGRSYIYSSFNFRTKAVVNMCIRCPEGALETWANSKSQHPEVSLGEIIRLHVLIKRDVLLEWSEQGKRSRDKLMRYENNRVEGQSSRGRVTDLQAISFRLHVLLEDIRDCETQLLFLMRVVEDLRPSMDSTSYLRAVDLLEAETSKSRYMIRWILNYIERAKIRLDLEMHLSVEEQTLNTSRLTKETYRDSSAMLTVAVVTMFFLPTTCVCAVLSISFFDFSPDIEASDGFQVYHKWWLFPLAAILLTILVFGVWFYWWRKRLRHLEKAVY